MMSQLQLLIEYHVISCTDSNRIGISVVLLRSCPDVAITEGHVLWICARQHLLKQQDYNR